MFACLPEFDARYHADKQMVNGDGSLYNKGDRVIIPPDVRKDFRYLQGKPGIVMIIVKLGRGHIGYFVKLDNPDHTTEVRRFDSSDRRGSHRAVPDEFLDFIWVPQHTLPNPRLSQPLHPPVSTVSITEQIAQQPDHVDRWIAKEVTQKIKQEYQDRVRDRKRQMMTQEYQDRVRVRNEMWEKSQADVDKAISLIAQK